MPAQSCLLFTDDKWCAMIYSLLCITHEFHVLEFLISFWHSNESSHVFFIFFMYIHMCWLFFSYVVNSSFESFLRCLIFVSVVFLWIDSPIHNLFNFMFCYALFLFEKYISVIFGILTRITMVWISLMSHLTRSCWHFLNIWIYSSFFFVIGFVIDQFICYSVIWRLFLFAIVSLLSLHTLFPK